jgi:heme/copper-type cytochrome/quinol oxidase subunit 3
MAQKAAEQELSRDELIALRNKRTGMTVFQLSWIMVFVCLFLVNLQIRANTGQWPPEGVARLDQVLPTVMSVLLLASGVTARAALNSLEANKNKRFFSEWRATWVLGVVFTVAMIVALLMIQDGGQYGTIARVMIAYHAIHAAVIALYMWQVEGRVRAGIVNARDSWSVEAGVKLWNFVIVAWVLFYVALYVI